MAARKHAMGFVFPAPPTDPQDIRTVPIEGMAFREANTPLTNERNFAYCVRRRRHNWVRSITHSLKQKVMPEGRKFWRVEESTVWCWDCGATHPVRHLEDIPITEAEYAGLKTVPQEGYQGVEIV